MLRSDAPKFLKSMAIPEEHPRGHRRRRRGDIMAAIRLLAALGLVAVVTTPRAASRNR